MRRDSAKRPVDVLAGENAASADCPVGTVAISWTSAATGPASTRSGPLGSAPAANLKWKIPRKLREKSYTTATRNFSGCKLLKTKPFIWCGRRDLNPHALVGRWILSPLRLPFRRFGLAPIPTGTCCTETMRAAAERLRFPRPRGAIATARGTREGNQGLRPGPWWETGWNPKLEKIWRSCRPERVLSLDIRPRLPFPGLQVQSGPSPGPTQPGPRPQGAGQSPHGC